MKRIAKLSLVLLLQVMFAASMLASSANASKGSKGSGDKGSTSVSCSEKGSKGSSDKGSKGSSDKGSKSKGSKDKKKKRNKDKGSKDKGSKDKGSKGSSDKDCEPQPPVCDDDSDKGSKGSSDKGSKGSSDKGSKDKGSKNKKGSKDKKGSRDKGSKGSSDKGSKGSKGSSDNDDDPCVTTVERDFGDAPASYGDASHIILTVGNPYIGDIGPDAETKTAEFPDSDDALGIDDESIFAVTDPNDSVFGRDFACEATLDTNADIAIPVLYVPVTGSGNLWGWIDWDANGNFDAGEEIVTGVPGGAGITRIAVPINYIPYLTTMRPGISTSYMRLRYSTQAVVGPNGDAIDGEVEDCRIILKTPGI